MARKKKKIFRIVIGDKNRKQLGFKLVEGTSAQQILKQPKSKFVGSGRTIIGVLPTKLRGTIKQRKRLPRSKRFGGSFK